MSGSDLFTDVFCVLLIHEIPDWKHIIQPFLTVYAVRNSNKPDTIHRKDFFRIYTDSNIVSTKSGKILHQNGSNMSFFYVLFHSFKIRTVKICSGVSVIHVVFDVLEPELVRPHGQQLSLIPNRVAFAFKPVISG